MWALGYLRSRALLFHQWNHRLSMQFQKFSMQKQLVKLLGWALPQLLAENKD
jgi:hypothetical protein